MIPASRRLSSFALSVGIVCALALEAAAASGTLTGAVFLRQGQGNFCPTTRNCTGALYLQAEFDTLVGIPEVKVQVLNSSGAVIGNGSTDDLGNFTVQWNTSGSLTNAKTLMTLDHKDSRFLVRNSSGATVTYNIELGITLVNGATQNRGGFFWGNAGNPDKFQNVYHGAYRQWANALKWSSRMITSFTNVVVRVDSPDCPNSCAIGPSKLVKLDTGAPFAPQARVMHEMGHIASYLSDKHKATILTNKGWYCYPNKTGTCIWVLNTSEWYGPAFEEGLATFIGDLALYNFDAVAPHTCLSIPKSACATGTFNTETSVGDGAGTDAAHTVINTTRYFWDIYDNPSDTATSNLVGCGGNFADGLGRDLFEIIDTLNNYVVGTQDHQNDEPFNSARTDYDNRDGRSHRDFNWGYKNRGLPSNTNSDAEICMNGAWPN